MLRSSIRLSLAVLLVLPALPAFAQTPPAPQPATPVVAPAVNQVAAMVNGQPIYEVTVQRSLRKAPPERRDRARADILDFLIDNILIEQCLQQMQVTVDPKAVDAKLEEIRAEIKKTGKEWENWLQVMQLTEAELKVQITADMRWNKYALTVATDKELRDYFEAHKETFDGTKVRARHILLDAPANDPAKCQQARAAIASYKKQIEEAAAKKLATLPATATPLEREQARSEALDIAFSEIARKVSVCKSKDDGGDCGYFGREGDMVEAFSKAAFALKPYEMSDLVETPFGYHLILVLERVGNSDVKFEDKAIKNAVLEVYADRKREEILRQVRQKSQIQIAPVAKP